jgi:type II secretory pathway component PulK
MTERGSALVTVLWLLVILGTAAAAVLSEARVGHLTSSNRVMLRRADWAAEACIEILMARYHQQEPPGVPASLDTTWLGPRTWCRATVEVSGTRMDVNALSPALWQMVLQDAHLADALLDWTDGDTVPRAEGAEQSWYLRNRRRPPRNGPLASVRELILIRGFDEARVRHLEERFTTSGEVTLDPNYAARELLHLLPGLDRAAVDAIVDWRSRGHRIATMEEFLGVLPRDSRERAQASYLELAQRIDLTGQHFLVDIEAGVSGWAPRVRARLVMHASEGRLAVLERQMQ